MAATNPAFVRVVSLEIPPGLAEVGIIEASGEPNLPELVKEFAMRCAKLGGALARRWLKVFKL